MVAVDKGAFTSLGKAEQVRVQRCCPEKEKISRKFSGGNFHLQGPISSALVTFMNGSSSDSIELRKYKTHRCSNKDAARQKFGWI